MSTLRWFVRMVWGDLRGHRGHRIDVPYAWCLSCESVVTTRRLR